jgi:hypothetical protein
MSSNNLYYSCSILGDVAKIQVQTYPSDSDQKSYTLTCTEYTCNQKSCNLHRDYVGDRSKGKNYITKPKESDN